ncbi:hypothetical protein E2P81_ATG00681 [Venturia nashicola]|nr:hypothetical protein E2P81_ATG00681 [Venturia nashicola]
MIASPESPLYPDWSWSYNSNVHIAKDRAWFTEFTPFSSFIEDVYTDDQQPVMGIGTVALHTHCTPESCPGQNGIKCNATLTLKHVLYVPSARCNVIGRPRRDSLNEYMVQMSLSGASNVTIQTLDGHAMACFDCNPLLDARWSTSEQARYTALQSHSAENNGRNFAMSEGEQVWLTRYYGSEDAFLRNFGLSILEEEEREEGRRIMAYIHGTRRPSIRQDMDN